MSDIILKNRSVFDKTAILSILSSFKMILCLIRKKTEILKKSLKNLLTKLLCCVIMLLEVQLFAKPAFYE